MFTDNSRFPVLLIENGWVEKLDRDLIPNIENLIPAQESPSFDPNREYSLPWQSGMTGIAWNPKVTGGDVTSIEQLLTDPALKGKVTMLSEMADSVGLVMRQNGDDPTAVSDETFDAAIAVVQKAVDSGQIRRFTGNDYAEQLTSGSIAAAVAWSGDVVQLQIDNPDLKFIIPDAGGMIWTDNMMIPLGGSIATALDVHELRLRPRQPGAHRRVRQLRAAGHRDEGGARRGRSGDRQQPADLPRRRHPGAGQRVRLGGAQQRRLHREVAAGARRVSGVSRGVPERERPAAPPYAPSARRQAI